VRLSQDPELLAASLPDVPRWVETRSLLLSGGTLSIAAHGDGVVVTDTQSPSGSLVDELTQRSCATCSPTSPTTSS